MWLGSSCCSYRLQIEAEGGVVDKTEIQKLRAEIETARGEVSRKRRKPAAPRHASASEAEPSKTEAQPSAKPHSSHTDTPGPALPGLEGVDPAMLTKAEDALANLERTYRAIRVSPCSARRGGPDHRLAPEPLGRCSGLNSRIFFHANRYPLRRKCSRFLNSRIFLANTVSTSLENALGRMPVSSLLWNAHFYLRVMLMRRQVLLRVMA